MDKNSFLVDLAESDRTDFGKVDFAAQSEEQRIFTAVFRLEGQVNNGGFEQYFVSSDGEAANFAPDALRQIGADACASIVERALRVISTGPLPTDQEERESLVESLDGSALERLSMLDTEFYVYPDDLTELLFAFVRSHPAAFGQVPQG